MNGVSRSQASRYFLIPAIVLGAIGVWRGFVIGSLGLYLGGAVVVGLYATGRWLSRGGARRRPGRGGLFYWLAALLLLPFAALWSAYGAYDLNAVLFHYQSGLGQGTETQAYLAVLAWAVLFLVLADAGYRAVRALPVAGLGLGAAGLALIALNPIAQYGVEQGVLRRLHPVAPIVDDIVAPVIEAAPARPTNLVLVYLESLEATYGEAEFAPAYAPLKALAPEALVFSDLRQMAMTGWSMAGIAASQCGVPLAPRGLFQRNTAGLTEHFLPDLTCLGDILGGAGYDSAMLIGANPDFAGIDRFYRQHGVLDIVGLKQLRARDPDDLHAWGMHDAVVFDAALETIARLEAADRPYFVTVETHGPHGPLGSLSRECRRPGQPGEVSDILASVHCTAQLAANFAHAVVHMAPDTRVVLVSDHLAHAMVPVIGRLKHHHRRGTLMVIGADTAPGQVTRAGTMVDVYPTLLELMGFRLRDHRAGMGVSLVSPRPSLVAALGLDELNRRVRADPDLSARLWGGGG